jgi:hypothetical protein
MSRHYFEDISQTIIINYMLRYLLFYIIVIFLLGCNTSSDYYDLSSVKNPQIILQARLIARQFPRVYVSKLWGATEVFPKETFLRNADVELFEDNQPVGKLFLKDSLYINPNYIIKANTHYTIKVNVEGLPKVESEPVLIPADVEIISATYDTKPTFKGTSNYFTIPCLVNVTFKKNEKIAGYGINVSGYNKEGEHLKCYNENLELGRQQVLIKSPCIFQTYNADIDLDGNVSSFTYSYNSYLSRCLDVTEKTVPIMVELRGGILANAPRFNSTPKSEQSNRLVVCINSVSDEVIELSKTIQLVEGVSAALSEPYPTYSNVKGGLGIVTGYNVGYRILTIK